MKSKTKKKVKSVKKKVGKPQAEEEEVRAEESRYVGCFASESSFLGNPSCDCVHHR